MRVERGMLFRIIKIHLCGESINCLNILTSFFSYKRQILYTDCSSYYGAWFTTENTQAAQQGNPHFMRNQDPIIS